MRRRFRSYVAALLRLAGLLLAGAMVGLILLANVRLYRPSFASYVSGHVGSDVRQQLRYLRSALDAGGAEDMQQLFPEGCLFSYATYGLAWVETGLRYAEGQPVRDEALREARWALQCLDSPGARAPFPETLDPPYGVFYVGWTTWLRGGVLLLQPEASRDAAELERFKRDCRALAEALANSDQPFLPSYAGQAWPCDSVVAAAALRLHERLVGAGHREVVDRWVKRAEGHVDPVTGLLPHRVDPVDGSPLEGPRGSSQALIQRFLVDLDAQFGRQQYALFREHFVGTFLGVPAIREFPLGYSGAGDVDSGPVVAGMGASATLVGLGAALVHRDLPLARPLSHVVEATGWPITWRGTKRYYLGRLPVADGFLVWSKTALRWNSNLESRAFTPVVGAMWRLPAHLLSLLVLTLTGIWFRYRPRRRTRRKQ